MIPTHTNPAREDQPPHAPHGKAVHSTETPTPIDTQRHVDDLIMGRTQPAKEEPVPVEEQRVGAVRHGDAVPYGFARYAVMRAVKRGAANREEAFNQHDVWRWLSDREQDEFRYYYKGTKAAISRVAQTLNSILRGIPFKEFPLIKIKGKNATYKYGAAHAVDFPSTSTMTYQCTVCGNEFFSKQALAGHQGGAGHRVKPTPPKVDPYKDEPTKPPHNPHSHGGRICADPGCGGAVDVASELPADEDPEFILIGYDLNEQPLYQDATGAIGYLTFTKLGL